MPDFAYEKPASVIKGGFYNKDLFRPGEKLTLVLQTGLAGIKYKLNPEENEEDKKLLESLSVGTELKLYRDIDNEHDKWAVAVCTTDDRDIGYITRFKNETIARLMDLGRQFKAYVAEPPEKPKDETEKRRTTAPTENYEIPMDVYMVER